MKKIWWELPTWARFAIVLSAMLGAIALFGADMAQGLLLWIVLIAIVVGAIKWVVKRMEPPATAVPPMPAEFDPSQKTSR